MVLGQDHSADSIVVYVSYNRVTYKVTLATLANTYTR
jgi:hypothetical protein